MGIIGRGVKACHLVGVVIIFTFCLYSVPMFSLSSSVINMVAADEVSDKGKSGALTIVESPESDASDDGDGIVSVEENEYENIDEQSHEIFEPTSEWKPVKKGQKIPPGLHVRLNMQTGEREAKLLDSDKKQMNEWYAGEKMGVINTEKQRYTRDELKKALKDFKIDDPEPDSVKQEEKNMKTKATNIKFRSYDQLKQMMKDMDMSVKTEAEIVTGLVNKLKDPGTNVEDAKTILIDLEYYLHQLDNARLFCDLQGMQVIARLMNNSQEEVRIKSLLVLGAASQSNAKVQVNAVENGIIQQLLRMISIDSSSQVKKKSLYALSTLLRQFPFAQSRFLEIGGLSAITDLFSKAEDESMKVKIITLLTDLVQEKDHNLAASDKSDEIQPERSRQYSQVKLREALQTSGWCGHISSLLHQDSDHDNVEKLLTAITILKDSCHEFHGLRTTLQHLSSHYKHLAKIDKEQGETDTFFDNIHSSIEAFLKEMRDKYWRTDL